MIKKLLLLLLVIGAGTYTHAQVTGTVQDAQNLPISGANIIIKGTTTGTITDIDGNFSINAKTGDILVISYLGFNKKEKKVTGNVIDVTLEESGEELNEIVLLGSRNKSRVATDSPVPIDVLNVSELAVAAPQTDLNQILNYVAPSFTSNATTVADGTDHIDPAQLRGLGPDQVLVLVNGKRRHTSSLVNVNGSPGRGSVGTDLNAIPAYAISRIEVLRDGASSQYGSDAIAGVINVVMKKNTKKFDIQLTGGGNASEGSNDHTGGWDGTKLQLDATYGLNIGEKGFVTLTGNLGWRDQTRRAGVWDGKSYNLFNAIEKRANEDGQKLSGLFDRVFNNQATFNGNDVTNTVINTIKKYAVDVDYLNPTVLANILAATDINTLQKILKPTDVTDQEIAYRGMDRRDYNMRIGQSKVTNAQIYANSEIPINDNATFYWFGGYGLRDGNSAGFFRQAFQNRTQTDQYVNGFLPEIGSTIKDASLAAGIRGKMGEWDYDLSNTFGQNTFLYSIENTSNTSMKPNQIGIYQDTFDAGKLGYAQNSINLDLSKHYDFLSGFNLAFGSEFRLEKYSITEGEEASWAQYNTDGSVNQKNPSGTLPTDFFGDTRPGGAQVFPGFRPENALKEGRHNLAFYVDTELDITEKFLVNTAVRFENYSDFGATFNYKVASRYKISNAITVRAAISTGFRAPSLAQKYFNSVSTLFVTQGGALVPTEQGLFRNDSRIAEILGIPELKQEKSFSKSLGFTYKVPGSSLSVTADVYDIDIDNRIVMSGAFKPAPGELQTLFDQAGATSAAFFSNAIDTNTKGLDFVITNNAALSNGTLKSDLALALSKTKQVGDIHASPLLNSGSNLTAYFDESSRVFLEEAVPRIKSSFTNTLSINKWDFFLRQSYFGKVTDPNSTDLNGDGKIDQKMTITGLQNSEHPVYSGKLLADLSVGYKFSDELRFTLGANNIFDTYPDINPKAINANNQFIYSRAVSQFGLNGRYVFARVNYSF